MKYDSAAIFLRDLGNMLISGVTLAQAVMILIETTHNKDIQRWCSQVLVLLNKGETLSSSLNNCLTYEAVMAIEAGEKAGALPQVLLMLADYYELREEIKGKVLGALGYPLMVFVILMGVFIFLATEVFPKLTIIMPDQTLSSPLTKGLLITAQFLRSHGVLLLLFILLAAFFIGYIYIHQTGRFYRLFVRLPLIGGIIKDRELALGFFALFILQKSGVPLGASLDQAGRAAGGATREHFERCFACLVGGISLSEAVREDDFFPKFTAETLRIGEETGRFQEYYERLYKTYYRLFYSRMTCLSSAVRPALLMTVAAFIMILVFGFLQPLYANLTGLGG